MALIKTDEEIQLHVAADRGTSLDILLPDIKAVEEKHIKKYLGAEQYADLVAAYTAGTMTEPETALLGKVQVALVNLAYAQFVTMNQVAISDSGIHIVTDGNRKTAFQWQIAELRGYFLDKGNDAVDDLLAFLEEGKDSYPKWAASAAFTINKEHFINSAAEFSRHYGIQDSRATFLALLPVMRKVEDFVLESALSAGFMAELKAQILAGNVSDDNKLVLARIRPALAHLTIAKAIGELSFSLQAGSIVFNVFRHDNSNSKEADGGLAELLSLKKKEAQQDGEAYLKKLTHYLNTEAGAEKYAAYFTSSSYSPLASALATSFQNSETNKFYFPG